MREILSQNTCNGTSVPKCSLELHETAVSKSSKAVGPYNLTVTFSAKYVSCYTRGPLSREAKFSSDPCPMSIPDARTSLKFRSNIFIDEAIFFVKREHTSARRTI